MSDRTKNILVIIGILVVLCCICFIVAGVAGYGFYEYARSQSGTANPFVLPDPATPTEPPQMQRPSGAISNETLLALQKAQVPEYDPYDIACRLKSNCGVPNTIQGKAYQVGDKEKFWVLNSDTVDHHQIDATLLYVTDHSYFWAEDGARVNKKEMKALMDRFESSIYPTDRKFFGSEWTPGVDGDPHIFVIYAGNIGHNIAGYFNSSDEYNPAVKPYSNGHETYVLGTSQDLGDEYTYTTLAHEFVHMIQFASDRNDVSWLAEGFAEVGAFINGYTVGYADQYYIQNPDLQLNDWVDNSSPDFSAHYGESFLYLAYFLDRLGKDASQALTSNPANDMTSVDQTIAALHLTDPATGQPVTADSFFMDWAAANLVNDPSYGDGRYTYRQYTSATTASATETISTCPVTTPAMDVHQYGVDYIAIQCTGDLTLTFTGSTATGLLPVEPASGNYAFWSNKGDESDMTLTREFDLTTVSGPVSFSYKTWYDIEDNWDYLYLEASTDGKSWTILKAPGTTDSNTAGSSYGWGYTGRSDGWVTENVDLSQYAGQKVTLRFEYVTDAALNGEGFLLDDVAVDAIGYSSDFEQDDGGWTGAGFVRVRNQLPQTFALSIVRPSDKSVTPVTLDADQTARIPLSIQPGETVYLIVTGTTRFTREHASYQIDIR